MLFMLMLFGQVYQNENITYSIWAIIIVIKAYLYNSVALN